MYHIGIDIIKKYLIIEISGPMSLEEVQEYIKDLTETVHKFEDKELSMLIIATRMDPLAQQCLPIFKAAFRLALTHMNKVAVVHSRFVTQMQMRRIEEEVSTEVRTDRMIRRFKTKKEALEYLSKEG